MQDPPADEPARPKPLGSLGAGVTADLRDMIISGALKPGQRLIVQELADHFATSRGPVRDALRALRAEGLVEPHAGRGVRVATLTAREAAETIAVRQAVEPVAARFAMTRHGDDLRRELDARLGAMREAAADEDWSALVTTDMDLHGVFYELSDVGRLRRLWDGMRLPLLHTFRLHRHYYSSARTLLTEHENLVRLVGMGDPGLVGHFLHRHIGGLADDLTTRLGDESAPFAPTRVDDHPPA
ncbi:GntR family transcriptional regulator [Bailinhaonella thermotolerans]|uniref:GntR family transcriptional regulator n=1 Tax=Bailinhaonella thermotolerans TaxID=1070861 RepID=A0A3A4AYS5_9ACTN|nr:GntR family transcriptional regulator [Bailinhaonella thermotolerans]RJL35517.1 GntR family transcriptional regulator [Bailinhaonella thermotolerans]